MLTIRVVETYEKETQSIVLTLQERKAQQECWKPNEMFRRYRPKIPTASVFGRDGGY